MIEKLKQFFTASFTEDGSNIAPNSKQSKQLAAAALMLDLIAVDDVVHESEKRMLHQLLADQFALADTDVDKLIAEAKQAQHQATDYYRFTSEINHQFSADEKVELIESLWRLAWADEEIQELEQHVIRRLANLLHVSHKDFIATKLKVMEG